MLSRISREQVRAAAKEEAFMLRFDEERALAALPQLLPSEAERREAVEIVRRIGYADGVITPESEAVLAKIERILGLDRAPDAAAPSASLDIADRQGPSPEKQRGQGRNARVLAAFGAAMTVRSPIDVSPPRRPAREYRVYPALIERCATIEPIATAIAHPCDESSLRGAIEAAEAGLIRPDPGRARGQDPRRSPSSAASILRPTRWSTRRTAMPPPRRRWRSCAPARRRR